MSMDRKSDTWATPAKQSSGRDIHGYDVINPKSSKEMDDILRQMQAAGIDPFALDGPSNKVSIREREPVFTTDELHESIRALKSRIAAEQSELDKLNEVVDYIERLPFKEGDAVFHPEHGNVLISGIVLNSTMENSSYAIILKNGKRLYVPFNSVVPISEATKVLFGKKKNERDSIK